MGFEEPCFRDTDDDMIRALLDTRHPFLDGITLEQLDARTFRASEDRRSVPAFRERRIRHALGQMRVPRRNARLRPAHRIAPGRSGLSPARFPLEMISPKNDDSMNSTFGNRPDTDWQTAVLKLHPADAGTARHLDRRRRSRLQRSRPMHPARRGFAGHRQRRCFRSLDALAETRAAMAIRSIC